jgi:hypothetical protein
LCFAVITKNERLFRTFCGLAGDGVVSGSNVMVVPESRSVGGDVELRQTVPPGVAGHARFTIERAALNGGFR